MNRTEIIQYLIDKYNYESYLEIGLGPIVNFRNIKCKVKNGVDPMRRCDYPMTSDLFFEKIDKDKKYDIIFIDGLHIEDQVDKDIKNSLEHLSDGGIIVMHDCNPISQKHQAVPAQQKAWNGTVWKSFVKLRCKRKDLFMCVIDTDHGCGIIKKGHQDIYKDAQLKRCLKYNFLKLNRKELLNLVSVNEFLHML